MRVEAGTIAGDRVDRVKINGQHIEYAMMADDEEGVVEALFINPEWLIWLHNDKVPKKVQKRWANHRVTAYEDIEVLGPFPVIEGVPSKFLKVRLRGQVEIISKA